MNTTQNIKYVKSCGFVAYKQIGDKHFYLLIKSVNGDIGFPKGHTEGNETELQTAIRELKEETGIDVTPISNFRHQVEYPIPQAENTIKQSVYFLGKCVQDKIICQETEVSEAAFLSYEEALQALTFNETKEILKCAESFINSI
jgi:tRNA nucleotidyltransferase (CCA-adding enzyme)